MKRRSRSHPFRRWLPQWGYTLIETLTIALVVGVLAAVAAPNLAGMLDAVKVDQSVTELRSSFQDAQRQAIRKNKPCTVQLSSRRSSHYNNQLSEPTVGGNCLPTGTSAFPAGVNFATNLQPLVVVPVVPGFHEPPSPSPSPLPSLLPVAEVKFGTQGSAEFSILSAVRPPLVPQDPTAKIVALLPDKPRVQKKCVAISSTLGLTRIGVYTGSTDPAAITDKGICTALDWKEQ